MSGLLHLTIVTPKTTVLAAMPARAVRAEDETGSFGILPGHADLLTVLPPSVVRWRGADGAVHFCAVRGGVLTVEGGEKVAIACRSALTGDRLEDLEAEVRTARAEQAEADKRSRVAQTQAHARAVRQLVRYLRPGETDDLGEILSGQRE